LVSFLFCASAIPSFRKAFLTLPGSTPAAEFGKARKLCFFGSFEEKAGEVFFPSDIAVVDEGDQPDARGPYHKTNDQGGSQSIHLSLLPPGISPARGVPRENLLSSGKLFFENNTFSNSGRLLQNKTGKRRDFFVTDPCNFYT
jgi:hypothetical protein